MRMRRRTCSALAAALGLAALAALPADQRVNRSVNSDSLRFYGEYGLWVERYGDTIRVAWLTRTAKPGYVQVLEGTRTRVDTRTTLTDSAHFLAFIHRGNTNLLIRYGALGDPYDRHETMIRMDLASRRRPAVAYTGVDSIFVMGDVHGQFDTLFAVLRNARIIDPRGRWTGGRAHLVVLGDMMDRGPDVTRLLWFLYGLEPQAERAGGRVHVILGNHEIMVMHDDLRYVDRKETSIALRHHVAYSRLFHPRRSILGAWLASKPALIRIDDVLLAHGGVSTDYLEYTLEALDDSLEIFTGEELFARWGDSTYVPTLTQPALARRVNFFEGPRSLLWYRDYVQTDTLGTVLGTILRQYAARIHVVAHTPRPTILERYGGSIIAVNTVPFAGEILLLVREAGGRDRMRYRTSGPAELLSR